MCYAIARDIAIDGLTHSDAHFSELSVILGGFQHHMFAANDYKRELIEKSLGLYKRSVVPVPLEDLRIDQVRNQN